MSVHRQPLVSVIIPAFNVEDYVRLAVESTLDQTYASIEVIVVDDGSTDGTARVLEEFGSAITLIRKPNGGIGSACNRGVAASHGEVIALLDADDVWYPTRVARCMAELVRSDAGFVTSDAHLIDEQGEAIGTSWFDLESFPADRLAQEIVRRNYIWVGALIWNSALAEVGTFDEGAPTGAEDYDMWLRLIAAGHLPAVVAEPLAGYRVRTGSLTAQAGGLRQARNRTLARNLPVFWDQGIYGPANQAVDIALGRLRHGRIRDAARFASAAFRDPSASKLQLGVGLARGGVRRSARAVRAQVS